MEGLFLKNTLPLYASVRLPDDGGLRWPKHAVLQYNEYKMFIVCVIQTL